MPLVKCLKGSLKYDNIFELEVILGSVLINFQIKFSWKQFFIKIFALSSLSIFVLKLEQNFYILSSYSGNSCLAMLTKSFLAILSFLIWIKNVYNSRYWLTWNTSFINSILVCYITLLLMAICILASNVYFFK